MIKIQSNFRFLNSPIIVKSFIASMDQALLSLVNFLIGIILIKWTSKIDYGYYSTAFPVMLFMISLQNAVINGPLAVLLISKKGEDKERYTSSLGFGQYIVVIPAVVLGLVCIYFLRNTLLDQGKAPVAAAVCAASIGILWREYTRSYHFAEEQPLKVLNMDVLYVIFMLVLIGSVQLLFNISVARIFLIVGISGLGVGLVYGLRVFKYSNAVTIKESYLENWQYGRWSLLGVIVTHLQQYSYIYLLGTLIGSTAVAEVSASRLLMMPLLFIQAGWAKLAVPHGSRLREGGRANLFFKRLVFVALAFSTCIAVYVGLLFGFSDLLRRFLFSDKYSNFEEYILYWGIVFIAGFITSNASFGLQAMKKFDVIAKMNLITMTMTVGCCYIFIQRYGIKGGLIGLILGSVGLGVLLWIAFFKEVYKRSP